MTKKKKKKQPKANKVTASSKPNSDKASATKVKQEAKKSEVKPKTADNVKAKLEVRLAECEKERDKKIKEFEDCKKEFIEWSDDLIDLEKKLDERKNKLNQRKKDADEKSDELKKHEEDLDRQDKGLKKREKDILDCEEDIKHRELDAEAGFAEKRRESLKQLDAEAEVLKNEFSNCRKQIADERAGWIKESEEERTKLRLELDQKRHEAKEELEAELEQKRKACDKETLENKNALDAESEALKNGRNKLEEEERNLRKSQGKLDIDREIFGEDKQHFAQHIEAKAAHQVEMLSSEIQEIQARLEAARQERDQLKNLLNEREEADRRFGHKTPDEIFDEMKAIREQRDQLLEKLDSRPGEDAADRLRKLEAEHEDWEKQETQDQTEIAELKIRLERAAIGVTEVETLRDQKKALETSRELLQAALEELRADVEERIRSAEGKSPFPACSGMDENSNFQASVPMTDQIDNLADFARDIQQRIAYDPATEQVLYYSMRDIRSFLGGLAMSHLHLLHGISGTGKTSLPLAFARAVGAGCKLVEVQAGWRDRQDLLGHFNSFERRYYESEFLQALYKAQCPAFQNRLYIVVLDEMNLSHPEQYFADMLSALEKPDEKDRLLTLMTAPVESAPSLLKEGRKLWIPSNVWFVGTANHDETTKDFADKTYDRSHVMELPRHRENFQINMQLDPRQPIAYNVLKQAFEKAKEQNSGKASEAYQFLESNLGEILGKSFRVGWGNRLERQMEDYVPVVIAAGGSIGEATDHILATKILRKIRDRYDNNVADLRELQNCISKSWENLDQKNQPERSLDIISDELRRLGEEN